MDNIDSARRSAVMASVPQKGSRPEMRVRHLLYSMGYRYRLHVRGLPGVPDIVFKGRRKIILVHGCFWHRHEKCKLARLPKSNTDFWIPKLERNRMRDEEVLGRLQGDGWDVLVIWECETSDAQALRSKLAAFMAQG